MPQSLAILFQRELVRTRPLSTLRAILFPFHRQFVKSHASLNYRSSLPERFTTASESECARQYSRNIRSVRARLPLACAFSSELRKTRWNTCNSQSLTISLQSLLSYAPSRRSSLFILVLSAFDVFPLRIIVRRAKNTTCGSSVDIVSVLTDEFSDSLTDWQKHPLDPSALAKH